MYYNKLAAFCFGDFRLKVTTRSPEPVPEEGRALHKKMRRSDVNL